jgi:hypothetical protein
MRMRMVRFDRLATSRRRDRSDLCFLETKEREKRERRERGRVHGDWHMIHKETRDDGNTARVAQDWQT